MKYDLYKTLEIVSNTPFEMVGRCGEYEIFSNEKDVIISYKKHSTRTIQKFGDDFINYAYAQAELFGAPLNGWEHSYIAEEVILSNMITEFNNGATILFAGFDGCAFIFNKEKVLASSYTEEFHHRIEEIKKGDQGKFYVFTDRITV